MSYQRKAQVFVADIVEWVKATKTSNSEIAKRAGVSRAIIGLIRGADVGEVNIKVSTLIGVAKARDEIAREERKWKSRLEKGKDKR